MTNYTIDVDFENGEFSFSGNSDAHGDLQVTLDTGKSVTITFKLTSDLLGDTFAGVKIARTQAGLTSATASADTNGNFYGQTCFEVSEPFVGSGDPPTLQLKDVDRAGIDDSGDWFYAIGVLHDDGSESWPDPKIHNLGGDQKGLPPGLYFGASKVTSRSFPPGVSG